MDYATRKWSKKERKSLILHILDSNLKELETSLMDVNDEDKHNVTQFISFFKSGSIQGCGFYRISQLKADKFIDKAYEIKNKLSLKPFEKLI